MYLLFIALTAVHGLFEYPVVRWYEGAPANLSLTISSSAIQGISCISMRSLETSSRSDCFRPGGVKRDMSFFVFVRPSFTNESAGIYFDDTIQGKVVYYDLPVLSNIQVDGSVGVRVVARPGWSQGISEFKCEQCSLNLIRVAMKTDSCQAREHSDNIFETKEFDHFHDALQYPFSIEKDSDMITVWTSADLILSSELRKTFLGRRLNLCFYESMHSIKGTLLGVTSFDFDSYDAEGLVFLVLFFFVIIPILCALTWAAQAAKMKRILTRTRDLSEALQVRQLEYELLQQIASQP